MRGLDVKDLAIIISTAVAITSLTMWVMSFGEFKSKTEEDWKVTAENSKKIEELTKIQIRLVTIIDMMRKEDNENNN